MEVNVMFRPATAALAVVLFVAGQQHVQAADTRASADTYVDGATTTTRTQNYGTQATVRVRNSGGRLAFVRFPNPSGGVPRAELLLRVDTVNVAGAVEVRRITSNWTETAVTYNTRPTMQTATIASRTIATTDVGKVVSFDITSLVQSWVANPTSNFGVAVVASTGSAAQVYFESREAGPSLAPVLRIQDAGPPPTDNQVTVGKSGADYTNPVSASRNAYAGDTWCQSPTDTAPCRMTIQPGIYILQETFEVPPLVVVTGTDMNATQLIARRGLEVAVRIAPSPSFADLSGFTVVNSQSNTSRTIGIEAAPGVLGARAFQVGVHVSGGSLPIAISPANVEEFQIHECRLSARGGTRAVGIGPKARNLIVAQTGISATGAGSENVGIDSGHTGDMGSLEYSGNDIVVRGGARAIGVKGPSNEDSGLHIVGGMIYAGTNADATGVDAGGGTGSMRGVRIVAQGGNFGVGAHISTQGIPRPRDILVEANYIQGSHIALDLTGSSGFELRRSQVTSNRIAMRFGVAEDFDPLLAVETSYFGGSVAVRHEDLFPRGNLSEFRNSVLAGALQFVEGNRYSCSNVYDGNGNQLNAQCQ